MLQKNVNSIQRRHEELDFIAAGRDTVPMKSVRVKICGVTRAEDIEAVDAAGGHAVGLNFVPASARFIESIQRAGELRERSKVSDRLLWAGVFVNASHEAVLDAVRAARLNIVQLHGDESPEYLITLRALLNPNVGIWKAFRVSEKADLECVGDFACDAVLVDAKCAAARGGSGTSFDWGILSGLKRTRPFVLAGGLTPSNVLAAIGQVEPDWVDTASGVESAPGVKQAGLIQDFMRAARCI